MQRPNVVDADRNGMKAVSKPRTELNQKNRIPIVVILLKNTQS
jgi:hypothetical protein